MTIECEGQVVLRCSGLEENLWRGWRTSDLTNPFGDWTGPALSKAKFHESLGRHGLLFALFCMLNQGLFDMKRPFRSSDPKIQ